jgi:hypothetical protein
MMDIFTEEKRLTDGSMVFNVVAKEDEDDEDEESYLLWAAPSEKSATAAAGALNALLFAFESANNDAAVAQIAAKVFAAAA